MDFEFKNTFKKTILKKFKFFLQILKFYICATKTKLNCKMYDKVLYKITLICLYDKRWCNNKILKVNIH